MKKNYSLLFLLFLFSLTSYGQVCPANSNPVESYKWSTHSKWFFGKGNVMSFGATGTAAPTISPATGSGSPFWAYESCASASDEAGNLILMTDGVNLWDGTGTQVAIPGGKLLTGSENPTGNEGSAVQGVMIVKHPLDINRYYIFTTDDAIYGRDHGVTNGFNYFTYDRSTNTCTGATRLGTFRSTEQVAATWHQNGVDVWISTHGSSPGGSTTFYSFLLECSGLNETAVVSNTGFPVIQGTGHDNERASLQFTEDGSRAAQTHHNGTGTWDPAGAVQIMNFDNSTGMFSAATSIAANNVNYSAPYDCEFSPSGNRLYVSNQCNVGSEIGYYDLAAGNAYTAIGNFPNNQSGVLKLGGDGNIYTGNFKDCGGWSYMNDVGTISNPDGAPAYNAAGVSAAAGTVGWGLPNMFIPPRDWLQIVDPGALTECDLPYDFSTNWLCKTTDAENTPRYENAYSMDIPCATCTIDPVTGVFNTTAPGTFRIRFDICTISDTLTFTVGTCGCTADVAAGPETVCEGANVGLDALLNSSSGAGVWTVDSVPTGAGTAATITDDGVDTTFNAPVGAIPGVYKVMFTVTGGGCKDSIYIRVNKTPVVTVNDAAICAGDPAATFTATSDSTAVSYLWSGGGSGANATTTGTAAGAYTVTVTDNNACEGIGTGTLRVNALPVVSVNSTSICAGDAAATFTATSDSTAANYLWSDQGSGTQNTTTGTTAGNYIVQVTDVNNCVASGIGVLTVNAKPTVTVNSETICAGSAAATFTATTTATVNGYLWSGQGTGNQSTTTGTIAGTYTVEITDDKGCKDTADGTLTVTPLPTPAITALGPYCSNDAAEAMSGTPNGTGVTVVWKINDVVNSAGSFDPGTAVITDNTVRYITTVDNCTDSTEITVQVNANKSAQLGDSIINACVFDPNPKFAVTQDGGTWSDPAVTLVDGGDSAEVDLAALVSADIAAGGNGAISNLVITYTQANPCGDVDQIVVSTTTALDATITQVGPYCQTNTTDVTLQAVDPGGTWSGTGITDANAGTFNPNTAGSGTHTITYTIPGNCGDSKTIDIVVDEQPDATISGEQNLCINAAAITLSVPTNVSTAVGTWTETPSTSGGFNSTSLQFDPANSATTAGSYVLDYSVVNGECSTSDQATIVVVDTPKFTINPIGPYCSGDGVEALSINPNNFPGGIWSSAQGGVVGSNFDPSVASTTEVNVVSYVASVTSDGQTCSATQTSNVTVEEQTTTTMPADFGMCSADAAISVTAMTSTPATTAGVYTATCPTCYNNTTNMFDPVDAGAGQHTITYTVGTNCPATAGTVITVTEAATVAATSPVDRCVGDETTPSTFTADVGAAVGTGVWSLNAPALGSIDPATGVWSGTGVTAGGTVSATYTFTTTDPAPNGCESSATSTMEIYDNPDVEFVRSNQDSCVAYSDLFTDNTNYSQSALATSTWDFGNGQTATDQGTASSTYTVAGNYTVSLSNVYANGCKDTDTLNIEVFPLPTADFIWSPTIPTTLDSKVLFINSSESNPNTVDVGYEWDFTSKGLPTASTETGPNITFIIDGDDTIPVSLVVTDNFVTTQGLTVGCTDTVIKDVIIQDIFQIYVPNAFTPGNNADGLNDTFYPVGKNWSTDNYEFVVLDRWGNLIFKTTNIGDAWDGTVNGAVSSGKIAQNDVYVWKITVGNIYTGKVYKKVGTVTLVR